MATFQETFDEATSEASDAVDADDVSVEAPDEVGQGDDGDTGTDSGAAPDYFNLEEVGDRVVQVKVDGELIDVPVKELSEGYMRQAAFTQKTQALAQEREQLQAAKSLADAYQSDPQATVRFLAEQNGITLAQAAAVAEQAEQDSWAVDGAEDDPRLSMIEQRFAELDRREARQEVESTLEALSKQYGEDFDANEVVNRAISTQSDDLEGTFLRMQGEKFYAKQQAVTTMAERTAAAEAQATAAKQQVGALVTSGGSAAGAGTAASAPITSVSDALAATLSELGSDMGWD